MGKIQRQQNTVRSLLSLCKVMGSPDSCLLRGEVQADVKGVCEDVILLPGTAAVMIHHFQERFQCFSLESLSSYACEDAE